MLVRVRYSCGLVGLLLLPIFCLATMALAELRTWGPRIGSWYTAPQSTPQSDAIVILGGNTFQRIKTGITLYENGVAPRILITGHNPDDPEDWEMQSIRHTLTAEDIPADDIIWVRTTSTLEDAQRIAEQVTTWGWKQVVVVSDWSHGRRYAPLTTSSQTTPSTQPLCQLQPIPDSQIGGTRKCGIERTFTETVKLLYYRVRH